MGNVRAWPAAGRFPACGVLGVGWFRRRVAIKVLVEARRDRLVAQVLVDPPGVDLAGNRCPDGAGDEFGFALGRTTPVDRLKGIQHGLADCLWAVRAVSNSHRDRSGECRRTVTEPSDVQSDVGTAVISA